jgi:hypothetical protein
MRNRQVTIEEAHNGGYIIDFCVADLDTAGSPTPGRYTANSLVELLTTIKKLLSQGKVVKAYEPAKVYQDDI